MAEYTDASPRRLGETVTAPAGHELDGIAPLRPNWG